ncbi:MAG: phenylacetate-CoA oxygenase subunit PaaJ [Cohaesibacteraceae bacterium]|nr:phenylacetate-CoA oxygenase subunit PaaJ [Cohaesibacteraceae bacterium]MBL4874907.1 phenylacetate-CoA oxygenase subunit PaaJ [Cohaesibacteraceae bacterium]
MGEISRDQPVSSQQRAWNAVAEVLDPEVPALTIEDLGVLRNIDLLTDGTVEVTITPTYTGCPAMSMFVVDIELSLVKAGFDKIVVKTVLSPAWTTDWLTNTARKKLLAYGIAPPVGKSSRRALFGEDEVSCPQCKSDDTVLSSEFGSTACKALYKCNKCLEPFEYFKCI